MAVSYGLGRVIHWLLLVGVVLGYTFLGYYYLRGYLNLNQFTEVTVVAALSILVLVLLLRPVRGEVVLPGVSLGRMMLVLPFAVFLCNLLEILFSGHLGFFSLITLVGVLTALALSRSSSSVALTATISLAVLIGVLYSVYTPSFGNDTWRDVAQATQIVERGGLRDLTIVHSAYPLPVVSLLYVIHSMVSGLNTLWSSSVVGLLYLLLTTLWVYILAKRLSKVYLHIAVLLALVNPSVVFWSVCFIPQTYSLLAALPLLFLNLHPVVIMALTVALVLGHGGLALWALIILALLVIAKKVLKIRVPTLSSVEVKLVIAIVLFTAYTAYTTLSMVLRRYVSNVIEAIITFLSGERITEATAPIQHPITAVLGIIPVNILITLGLVVLVKTKDTIMRLLTFTSLAALGIAYIGAVTFPALDPPRYLGLGSISMLIILSPRGIRALTRRGRIGVYYALSLVLLAITSFGFAGTLMPGNPYTANPYASWSISGLITYGEAQELKNIASLLCCNNYLVDWRTGVYMVHEYLWVQPQYRGFYNVKTDSSFTIAGTYGLLVTPEYLTHFNGIFIFRRGAISMPEAFAPQIVDCIKESMTNGTIAVYYSSNHIVVISRS